MANSSTINIPENLLNLNTLIQRAIDNLKIIDSEIQDGNFNADGTGLAGDLYREFAQSISFDPTFQKVSPLITI